MRNYEKYTFYKEVWNKSFPSNWELLPLYALGKVKSITEQTDLQLLSVYLDAGVIPFASKAEKRTNVTSKDLSKYQRVDPGDFVLNNQQAWRGSVGVSFDILDACAVVYKELDTDDQIKFKSSAKAFCRTYGFLGAILPYGNAEWERLSIFLNLLIPKLPSPRDDDFSEGIHPLNNHLQFPK